MNNYWSYKISIISIGKIFTRSSKSYDRVTPSLSPSSTQFSLVNNKNELFLSFTDSLSLWLIPTWANLFLTPQKCVLSLGYATKLCLGRLTITWLMKPERVGTPFLCHFLAVHGLGEKWVHLHCDNCSGQNKNRFLMFYLMYWVLYGLHDQE